MTNCLLLDVLVAIRNGWDDLFAFQLLALFCLEHPYRPYLSTQMIYGIKCNI